MKKYCLIFVAIFTHFVQAQSTLPNPQIISPGGNTLYNQNITFLWTKVEEAEKYQIQIWEIGVTPSKMVLDTLTVGVASNQGRLKLDYRLVPIYNDKYSYKYIWLIKAISNNTHSNIIVSLDFQIGSITSIDSEQSLINALNVFPNPTEELVNVTLLSKEELNGDISMYNVVGQLIFKSDLHIKNGTNQIIINVSAFNKGIYFLRINTTKSILTKNILII